MEDIIKLIVDNGIGVGCVIYLIYFQLTTMKEMQSTLVTMTTTLQSISDRLNSLEEKIKK